MSSVADFVAVIDGDLQHDESALPEMYRALAKGNLAVGTRLREAGGGTLSPARQALSDLGAWFFKRVTGAAVTDPMSGFFVIQQAIVSCLAPRLSPDGFKILVDVILSAGGDLNIVEVPYRFRKRSASESKLTPLVGIDFLGLVVRHATGGILPIRFVLFAMIGASDLVVHIAALSAALHWFRTLTFDSGQVIATIVAMASNFILNNEITYSSYRYRGIGLIERGLCTGMQRRGYRQYWRRFLALQGQSDLLGRRPRRRIAERGLELRGKHKSHLATGSPPPRVLVDSVEGRSLRDIRK
jgi:dolichol-phosphate mannosyltransferase